MNKLNTLRYVVKQIEDKSGIQANNFRLWYWCTRQNMTNRPYIPIPHDSYDLELRYIRQNQGALSIFVESNQGSVHSLTEDLMIFVKQYKPGALQYCGKLWISKRDSIASIYSQLKEVCGIHQSENIYVWEEQNIDSLVLLDDLKLFFFFVYLFTQQIFKWRSTVIWRYTGHSS